MRIAITGICGFVGASLARFFKESIESADVCGLDNLLRPGSELNRGRLRSMGIEVLHGDVRMPSDLDQLPAVDWVIDAAANPSVLAGIDGRSSSRQIIEHNLVGTLNVLEYCKRHQAGFLLLSSSRVYSITALSSIPVRADRQSFVLDSSKPLAQGLTAQGISEEFSVAAPVSLYGSTKLASETMALEYGFTFDFPVWINRCGVLAGAGQFGTAEQGIFSYWMHAHAARRPLRYIGFGGCGFQVRDAFHPEDLGALLLHQMRATQAGGDRIFNAGGGVENAMSLAELTAVCDNSFGPHKPSADTRSRKFDVPWVIMDSTKAKERFGWKLNRQISSILDEIAAHARSRPEWLDMCEGAMGNVNLGAAVHR